MTVGDLVIERIAYHRNGVGGAGFHVVLFAIPKEEQRMLAVVFDEPGHVAVFDRRRLAQDTIAFGQNSWRGDNYETDLRQAITVANGAWTLDLGARGLVYEFESEPSPGALVGN